MVTLVLPPEELVSARVTDADAASALCRAAPFFAIQSCALSVCSVCGFEKYLKNLETQALTGARMLMQILLASGATKIRKIHHVSKTEREMSFVLEAVQYFG